MLDDFALLRIINVKCAFGTDVFLHAPTREIRYRVLCERSVLAAFPRCGGEGGKRPTPTVPRSARGGEEGRKGGGEAGLCEPQPVPVGAHCASAVPCRTHADRGGSEGGSVFQPPTMSPGLLLCVALAACHGTRTCGGFNVDVRFPVVKEGQTAGSLFGFSVALHQQKEGSAKYL